MTTHSRGPGISAALECLRKIVGEYTGREHMRLPPLVKLAELALVSRNTMWKAANIASGEGLLTIVRGGGMHARGTPATRSKIDLPDLSARSIWQKKCMALEKDIVEGAYVVQGKLPSAKEMQATYGVSKTTLKKMLDSLTVRGIIARDTTGVRPAYQGRRRISNTIVLVSEGIVGTGIGLHDTRLREIIKTLESDYIRLGVRLEFVETAMTGAARANADTNLPADSRSVFGYIFNMPEWQDETTLPRIHALLRALVGYHKPVAIFDSMGISSLPPDVAGRRNARLFRIAAYRAGRQVARHLLNLGHTRVAYLSLLHIHVWSMKRLAGLVDEFAESGHPNGVVPIVIDKKEFFHSTNSWLEEADSTKIDTYLASADSRDAEPALKAGRLTPEWSGPQGPSLDVIRADMVIARDMIKRLKNPIIASQLRDAAVTEAAFEGDGILIEPLLRKALTDPTITAWVGANDGTAFSAQKFLERNHVDVPAQISVVGFDNVPRAFEMRLTTYDFSMPTILHRMLWFIMHPDTRSAKRMVAPQEVDGMIIERATTGRAKRES